MRRTGNIRPAGGAVLGALTALLAACAPAAATTDLPSFPSAATTAAAAGPARAGIPGTCEELLPPGELEAVLGLPIETVSATGLRGQPAPTVGRLDRLTCRYVMADPARAARGPLLVLVVGDFVDAAAARRQSELNTTERAAGSAWIAPLPLGAARAELIGVPGGAVLMLDHRRFTVDVEIPGVTDPEHAGTLLGDIARRVLARLLPPGAPAP